MKRLPDNGSLPPANRATREPEATRAVCIAPDHRVLRTAMQTITRYILDPEDAVEDSRCVSAAIARVERDESLKGHLNRLGMPDAEAYRQWCRHHGLSTRLAKSPLARDKELGLMHATESWRFLFHEDDSLRRFDRRNLRSRPRRTTKLSLHNAVM